jgi:MFS transporter, DHA1 family, tetracycline resistance protein
VTGPRRTPQGFWPVWTTVAVDLLGFGIIIPLLPLYATSFGASPVTIGFLFASYSLAQLVFSPIWGRISDRVGRKPIIMVTIAGSAIGSLTVGLAGTIPLLFLGRIIDGASGSSVAIARAVVADLAPPAERARLMGLLGAAFGVGFVVGPAIGALATIAGPSAPFLVAAAISSVNLVVTSVRLPQTVPTTAASDIPRPPMAGLVGRLLLVGLVAMTAFSAFEATLGLLGRSRLDMADSTVALVFVGVGIVLVAVQALAVGPLVRRLGDTGALRLGLAANVVGLLLLARAFGWPQLIAGLGFLAAGQALLIPALASSLAGSVTSDRTGAVLGAQQSAVGLARVIGPAAGGALFAVDPGLPYLGAAAITAVIMLAIPRHAGSPTIQA